MEIKKVNLDREKVSSTKIQNKQNFDGLVQQVKALKSPMWKNPLFYGPIGLSSIALAVFVFNQNQKINKPNYEKTTTLTSIQPTSKETLAGFIVQPTKKEEKNSVNKKLKTEKPYVLKKKEKASIETSSNLSQVVQAEEGAVKSSVSNLPTIQGVNSGKLNIEKFKHAERIEVLSGVEVTSYTVQYFDGKTEVTKVIQGAELTQELKKDIIVFNTGEMIFFTNVEGRQSNGDSCQLGAMNIRLVVR